MDIHNSYIPVPGSLDDFRTSALLAGSPAFLPPEPRATPYRRTSSRVRSSTRNSSSRVASAGGATSHSKKLRKSENQVEVLKRFFTTNAKPGRDKVREIAEATGLSFLEVRNWFRNARLRNKDDKNGGYTLKTDDCCDVVSSSTEDCMPLLVSMDDIREEMTRLWTKLDDEDRKSMLPTFFKVWDKDSPSRTEAIKSVLRCLSTTEKNYVHGAVKPRGPYRCSSDKNLSKTTILERAKTAWKELERIFGANKREKTSYQQDCLQLNLDQDMLEGLKSLFQAHRDYLYYLVKNMGIDTSDDKDMGKLKAGSGGVTAVPARYPPVQDQIAPPQPPAIPDDVIVPYLQYAGHTDMLQGYPGPAFPGYHHPHHQGGYPSLGSTAALYPAEFPPYYSPTSSAGAYHTPLHLASPTGVPPKGWPLDLDPKASYYGGGPEPDMKTEKMMQSETKTISMKAPFSEMTSGTTFNTSYNTGTEESAEITLVKTRTSLKYHYEFKTFNKSTGNSTVSAALPSDHHPTPPALPPCGKSSKSCSELV
eukprot:sb/3463746/